MKLDSRRVLCGCAGVLALFGLNLYIVLKLFGIEYLKYLHSNEGTYIAIARFVLNHPTELLWWPFWKAGMPFQNTYFPLLHLIVALLAKVTGLSPAHSFHAVSAFFYCLGPVTLFLMAWGISGRPGYSFFAGLAYSLVSPSTFLNSAIRVDAGGLGNPRRLQTVVFYGESPHVAALALVPLAVLFLYFSLKYRRPWFHVLTGLLMAAVVLTNAFGATTLAMAVVCLLCAVGPKSFWRNLGLVLVISALSYLWISPWIPPSLLESIRFNAFSGGGYYFPPAQRSLVGVAVLAVFVLLGVLLRRYQLSEHLQFFLLFAFATTSIALLAFSADIFVLPQARRYFHESEMAVCLLVFAAAPLLDRLPRRARAVGVVVLLVLAARQTIVYRRYARRLIQPIDITRTYEYETARWFDVNFKGQRVMPCVSCSFWLNVFTDVPQLGGGHEPSAPNWIERVATFTIYTGLNAGARDGEVAIVWLKAFGTQAIQVSGPNGSDHYNVLANPKKFEGRLPVLWRQGDDTIYRIPQRSASLAHVIPAGAVARRVPIHGLDTDPVLPYIAALDDPSLPLAEAHWHNFHSLSIRTNVQRGQVVSAQITYHPGWHASVNGRAQKTFRDGIGLLVIEPDCQGPCTIDLVYDGGAERKVTRMLSIAVTLGVLAWFGAHFRRRPPAPA